ncbi:hypothetical protein BDC45DRAFT_520450 [Circinella umbellata]|nr:hypothetical protein BDC45DRAFT_520450 [Circinella umbellata]
MSGGSPSKSNKKSAVSNVVNDLIRAAVGGDTNNVADDDIDKYVAELILKEAEAKRKKYDNEGVRAYQPDFGAHQPNNLPKPNKRFFLNMIKATDSYNQSLKEQEEITKKEEQEFKQRKRRHEKHEYSSDEYQKKRRHHYDSVQNNSDRRQSAKDDNDRLFRRRGGSQYDSYEQQRRRESSSSQCDDDKSDYRRRDLKKKRHNTHHRNRSPSRNNCNGKNFNALTTTNSAPEKPTSLPVVVRGRGQATQGTSSNMDKYFSKNYDPLLDVEPDLDEMVYTQFTDGDDDLKTKKKRKKDKKDRKKKSKKKKSKKEKEETDSNDDDSDYARVESPPPLRKPIRAWDVGK